MRPHHSPDTSDGLAPDATGAAAERPCLVITGSVATDHLTTFPGLFTEQLVPDRLDKVSLSFLVDELEVRRGGVAANISYGLGGLGLRPVLVGAVGADFAEYEVWLKEHGVDTGSVRVSTRRETARFMCTTDRAQNQIASFYAGAMAEAADIDLHEVFSRTGTPDLVLVSPNDPGAMLRHTAQCAAAGVSFAADPSQQLPRLDRAEARRLVTGARWLFTNDYEGSLLRELTGWSTGEVLSQVGGWVTTLGAEGVRLERADQDPVHVPAVPVELVVDPTGGGDAFRAGFLAAAGQGLDAVTGARLGCAMAATALEQVGPQGYEVVPGALLERVSRGYGPESAALLARAGLPDAP
ncbi:carbohydrate kinase family protein [Streptomyces sp. NPDC007346]|uniref:carbohydrate kinase family protein n=1 Tax=Streptomyces sp. NPDC007346 TaxID=3154682 RepID=UPI003454AAC3